MRCVSTMCLCSVLILQQYINYIYCIDLNLSIITYLERTDLSRQKRGTKRNDDNEEDPCLKGKKNFPSVFNCFFFPSTKHFLKWLFSLEDSLATLNKPISRTHSVASVHCLVVS
jgi:hypothetical protein